MAKTKLNGMQIAESTIDTDRYKPSSVTNGILAPTGVAAGEYSKLTVDIRGRVLAGSNPTTLAGHGIQDGALNTPSFVVAQQETTLPNHKVLSGTSGEIVTSSGENLLTVSIAPNPTIPGTASITLPTGTTAQRPESSQGGMVRYNSTTGKYEASIASQWYNIMTERHGTAATVVAAGIVHQTSGTTTFPTSNSTPTSDQGVELWNSTVSRTVPSSKFLVEFSAPIGVGSNNRGVVFALFRDNTEFVGLTIQWADDKKPQSHLIRILDNPPTGSGPFTYSVRTGIAGGNGTWYIGAASNTNFGGINDSHWTIQEVA
jgi:hypothetical protein